MTTLGASSCRAARIDDILSAPNDNQGGVEIDYSMPEAAAPTGDDCWIYHFTHIGNLAAIRTSGHLNCDVVARQGMTRTAVGATDIKEWRRQRVIPIDPGGHVGDYVPFYFAPRSPMLYRIALTTVTAFRTVIQMETRHWRTW